MVKLKDIEDFAELGLVEIIKQKLRSQLSCE